MLKLPRPERNGKHFVSYCNKRNKSDNDYSIAQAVFRHMGDILPLSQEQLAAESHQSEASASRFFRRCGFASFWEFKTQMVNFLTQRRLRKTQETLNRYHGMTDREVSRELCRHAVQNLEQTAERMDLAQLARIVELFRQSEQVYFVGDMRELECFYSLQLDLMCKGQAVYHCNFDEVKKDELPAMNEKTVVCIFSVSERYYRRNASCCWKKPAPAGPIRCGLPRRAMPGRQKRPVIMVRHSPKIWGIIRCCCWNRS